MRLALIALAAFAVASCGATATHRATALRYCRRPDNSGAELSASQAVACATARAVESRVFSRACVARTRCTYVGFTCRSYWPGTHNEPFTFTHHAICRDGTLRIRMDEG